MAYEPVARETVKIATDLFDSGYMIINAEDFDEDTMVLYSDGVDANTAAQEAAVAPKRRKK